VSLPGTPRRLRRVLQFAAAAVLSAAAVVTASPPAHADPLGMILTDARDGRMLCGYTEPDPLGPPPDYAEAGSVTLTISTKCEWQFLPAGNGNYYLYNMGYNEYLTMPAVANAGGEESLQSLFSGAAAVNEQQWNLSGQTGDGGFAIRPATNLNLYLNMNGPLANTGTGPTELMLNDWSQDHWSMSWQSTMFSTGVTAPAATLTAAPFATGPKGLLVDQSALQTAIIVTPPLPAPPAGMALCADTGDSNLQLQVLGPNVNPYCLWQQSTAGSVAGTPSNAYYLYNPATGKVLDINSTGPLTDPTPVNLQPFYTSPLQSYEWWNPTATVTGTTAFRPYWNTDLNLNGFYTRNPAIPAAVTAWSTGITQPQMSWTFIGVS
jgi:hypothetical protein